MTLKLAARSMARRIGRASAHPDYRRTWVAITAVVVVLDCIGALLVEEPLLLGGMGVALIVTIGLIAVAGTIELDRPVWSAVPVTVASAAYLSSFYALASVLHVWAAVVLLALGATCPRLWGRVACWTEDDTVPDRPTVADLVATAAWRTVEPQDAWSERAPTTPDDVPSLTTQQLCRWWTLTTAELSSPSSPRRRLELVTLRAACLEEMWIRDEQGCARWFLADAVSTDPARFVRGRELT